MKNKIFLILKKELREVFRDKKSLSMMLITPLLIPLIVIGFSAMFDSQTNKIANEYNKIGFSYNLTDEEKEIIKYLNINYKDGSSKDIKKYYKDGDISVYVDKEDNNYTIYYDENNEESLSTINLAEEYLNQYKLLLQNNYLVENNIDSNSVLNIIKVNEKNIGKKEDNFFAKYMTSYAFIFVIMAITISSTYPATDTTAGEKERGTMETLLTFPIRKKDIIIGKYLSVSLSSFVTGILGFILSIISLKISGNMFDIYKDINLVPNTQTIIVSILIIIAYSFLISGLCIGIASFSKSFKEAQSALSPITLISVMPSMIGFLVNLKTNNLISVIPFLNYNQIFNDINSGNYNFIHILLMFISTFVYIGLIIVFITRQYKSENILFKN